MSISFLTSPLKKQLVSLWQTDEGLSNEKLKESYKKRNAFFVWLPHVCCVCLKNKYVMFEKRTKSSGGKVSLPLLTRWVNSQSTLLSFDESSDRWRPSLKAMYPHIKYKVDFSSSDKLWDSIAILSITVSSESLKSFVQQADFSWGFELSEEASSLLNNWSLLK